MKIAIVGFGKIARDQHVPAIAASDAFELAATASRHAHAQGLPAYTDIDQLLAAEPDVAAVALCQPPQVRHAAARAAIAAGRHVFLEKPPGATLSEVADLAHPAESAGVTLFASWHSRYAAGVEAAREWLIGRTITAIHIAWKEDVRHWHPGQNWIWEAGGLGVFDPGINALSILTRLLRLPVRLEDAVVQFPSNRAAPIAAELTMRTSAGAPITAEFDWRQTGPQTWDIVVETAGGALRLTEGGNRLYLDGVEQPLAPEQEYPALYARFARLIDERRSDVDMSPLKLVADAFLRGTRQAIEPFED